LNRALRYIRAVQNLIKPSANNRGNLKNIDLTDRAIVFTQDEYLAGEVETCFEDNGITSLVLADKTALKPNTPTAN
jgi:hypothetical protein